MPYAATIYAFTVVGRGHLMPYAAAIYTNDEMASAQNRGAQMIPTNLHTASYDTHQSVDARG
jgi:hypothetical protein